MDVEIDSASLDASINHSIWLSSLQALPINVLLNNEPINDKLINAAQQLLKMRFPHIKGFQDPLLKDTSFSRQTPAWVCSTANEECLYILDSMPTTLIHYLSIQ